MDDPQQTDRPAAPPCPECGALTVPGSFYTGEFGTLSSWWGSANLYFKPITKGVFAKLEVLTKSKKPRTGWICPECGCAMIQSLFVPKVVEMERQWRRQPSGDEPERMRGPGEEWWKKYY